jgi:hypothetical protein
MPAKKQRGRPLKLTPEVIEKIVEAIELGATFEHAANYAGVSYSTFARWRQWGEEAIERRKNPNIKKGTKEWNWEQPFIEFWEAIKGAEGQGVITNLKNITSAGKESWQASAWILDRRYPKDYGRRQLDVNINNLPDLSQLSDEELAAFAEKVFGTKNPRQ